MTETAFRTLRSYLEYRTALLQQFIVSCNSRLNSKGFDTQRSVWRWLEPPSRAIDKRLEGRSSDLQ